MKTRWSVSVAALLAVLALAFGAMVGFGSRGVSAQAADASHPAHIHNGTCGAGLGDVVYPLSNVGGPMMNASGTPEASMPMGATDAIPVEVSVTTVQTTLAELTSKPYAINVHESADNIGNYIACGNVGGAVMGSDLAIGLGELNGSGYSGVAWLHDNGDGSTTVTVFLTQQGEAPGTPVANG
ncbi:MAG TPA: hypothetical protein VH482_07700 [Thermomicrobiales bacterium]